MKKILNFISQEKKVILPTLFFAILLFAMMFVVTFLINLNISRTVAEEALLRGKGIASYIESCTREAMLKENKKQIDELVNKNTSLTDFIHSVIKQDKNIKYVLVQDSKGKTIINIESNKKDTGEGYSYNRKIDIKMEGHSVVINENKVTVIKDFPRQIFDVAVPIKMGKQDVGLIRLGLSSEKENRIIQATNNKVIQITTYASMIGFVLILIAFLYASHAINKSVVLETRVMQAEKLAYVGELASGLAHEIRNPLNAMGLNIQMLEEDCALKVDEKEINKMKKIHNEIFHLEKILTAFLDFAKPNLLEKEPTNIKDLILEIVDLMKPEMEKKQIDLSLELEKNIPLIHLDRKKVKQAIYNLIINAIQASNEAGKILLKVSISGKKLYLEIIDNGCGMSEDTQKKIFTLFYSSKEGGTGIGLSVVQKIAREHNGEIAVKSKLGEGSNFTIILPLIT
ncbi:GHKL domain-containing protein [Candidatus Poribacteria bacterium]|nr:GHKL domain-containing protein [Candidatus Poribacteria bacterium]